MFSIATVASSTRMPTASARPPSVMMLIVSPSALSTMIDVRIDSGIETAMISVLRQLPRNSRIISAVRQAAITASRTTPLIDARTNSDWSASGLISSSGGSAGLDRGSAALTSLTMSSVDALPSSGSSAAPRAGRRRGRCWSAADSRRGRARRRGCRSVLPPTVLIGRSFSSSIVFGAAVHVDVVFVAADLRRAGRQDQVLRADRVDDVGRREALRLQRRRVEVDLDLRLLAAVRVRNLRALHRGQLRAQEVHADVEQLLLRQALARQRRAAGSARVDAL